MNFSFVSLSTGYVDSTLCSLVEDTRTTLPSARYSLSENRIRSLHINGSLYWRPVYSGGKKRVPQWPAALLELNDGADHSSLQAEHVLTGYRILNHSAWTVGGGSLIGTTNTVLHKTIWYAASVAGFHMMNNTQANKWAYLRGIGTVLRRMEYSLVKIIYLPGTLDILINTALHYFDFLGPYISFSFVTPSCSR
jgi:hypothetical protein